MSFDRIGPLGTWNKFDERWIGTRLAARWLLIATLFVLTTLPLFFGNLPSSGVLRNVYGGVAGIGGTISIFYVWIGMWKYWARLDESGRWSKRFWFAVMLIGFWYGSCLYCWCAYLPQVIRSDQRGVTPSEIEPTHGRGVFGKSLVVAWFFFFLFSVLLLFLRKEADFAFPIFGAYSVVLVLTTFACAIAWLYRQGVRHD